MPQLWRVEPHLEVVDHGLGVEAEGAVVHHSAPSLQKQELRGREEGMEAARGRKRGREEAPSDWASL